MDYTQYKKFEFRRTFFKFFGASINIFDPLSGAAIGYIEQKGLRLKTDISIYRDRTKQQELMHIVAQNVFGFSMTYNVTESTTGQALFSLRRKGMRSAFVRDYWEVLDTAGNVVGALQETSSTLAMMRRWFEIIPYVGPLVGLALFFVPRTYSLLQNDGNGQPQLGASIIHRINPLQVKMDVDTTVEQIAMHKRVVFAATALLATIDANTQ